jgi:hypothetical protein
MEINSVIKDIYRPKPYCHNPEREAFITNIFYYIHHHLIHHHPEIINGFEWIHPLFKIGPVNLKNFKQD